MTTTSFLVSIVTPVYNCEPFLERAVESAVHLPQTGEIILVEDGSPDNALAICQHLASKYPDRVKLFRHPNGENRGAGATRNLGLRHVQFPYLAFMDADDYFLPNRFTVAEQIFLSRPEVDGVYEGVGVEFYSENGKRNFQKQKGISEQALKNYQTNFLRKVEGQDVFKSLVMGKNGHFCTDGIIVRTSLLEKSGYFNEELRLHQDTELYIRFAYHGLLVPGEQTLPVAIRGVHGQNRITARKGYESRYLYWLSLFNYFIKGHRKISRDIYWRIFRNSVKFHPEVVVQSRGLKKYADIGRRLVRSYIELK